MARAVGRLGRVGSWLLAGGLLGASLIRPWACKDEPHSNGVGLDEEAVLDVLASVGATVVLPAIQRAGYAGDDLFLCTVEWKQYVDGGLDGEAERESARVDWRDAMEAWQEVEVMQIGPAGSSLTAIAGEDLRDEIYSWPTVNRCLVDQITVSGGYEADDFFDTAVVTAYGLDALEVLLFTPDDENGCAPQVDINADGSWDALGVEGVKQRRAEYAVVVATGIRDRLDELDAAWNPYREDFLAAFTTPGSASSPYATPSEALDAVFDALVYLETMTKDRKLGRPLGLTDDCAGTECLEEVESPYAEASNDWIEVNIEAFRDVFDGGYDGVGIDDLLVDVGHAATADAMHAALDTAVALAEAIEEPIEVAAGTDPRVLELHSALADVTDLLKGDVATVLALSIPDEAAGDND